MLFSFVITGCFLKVTGSFVVQVHKELKTAEGHSTAITKRKTPDECPNIKTPDECLNI